MVNGENYDLKKIRWIKTVSNNVRQQMLLSNVQDPDMDFGNDMTTDEKKKEYPRMGYLEWGVLDDWGDEDMTPINTIHLVVEETY